MKILVVNCGSSTLKFELFAVDFAGEQRLARGIVDGVGASEAVIGFDRGADNLPGKRFVADHREASLVALVKLGSAGFLEDLGGVGHRIVHGGDRFRQTTLITEEVLSDIRAVTGLAPLHNKPSLDALQVLRDALGGVPMVAVFDTAFHRTMPDEARLYAIPQGTADRHHIQRYGFHGLAHRYMAERCARLMASPVDKLKLITLQLGNGCSATAVKYGKSVDTSMGLTPLEGLVMGTRSGDIDPTLAGYLARKEEQTVEAMENWLNTKCGLFGVSGRSGDMRDLLKAEREGDGLASLAIGMFCYRVRKFIGAYMAVLGGADAITFGGGIGENAPAVRERILDGMEWCGIKLSNQRNMAAIGKESLISVPDSGVSVYVIPVDEASIIARETFACLVDSKRRM